MKQSAGTHRFGERDEPGLIGVRREPIEHDDLGVELVHHAEDLYLAAPLGDPPAQRVLGLKPDNRDRVARIADRRPEVMENASALAHPAAGDHDRGSADALIALDCSTSVT